MATPKKKIAIGFNVLTLIPSIVKLVEVLHGGASGADKKQAAKDVAAAVLTAGGNAVAANNPAYQDAIGQVIDGTVASLNAGGQMPDPAQP